METELLRYGYIFVVVGTIFEGDATLLTAAFLAHRGYLHLPWVLAIALVTTFCAAQVYFHVARRTGAKWMESMSSRGPRFEKIVGWSKVHAGPLMFASRFMLGFRTVIPVVCGANGMRPGLFAVWNAVGAFVWTAAFGSTGYLGGHVLTLLVADVRQHEKTVAAVVAIVGAGLILWRTHGREIVDLWRLGKMLARVTGSNEKGKP